MEAEVRQYGFPLALAVLLHAVVVGALLVNWNTQHKERAVLKPQIMQSTLVMLDPTPAPAKPAPPAPPPPKPEPEPKPAPKPEPKPEPKPAPKPEPKPEPKPAPKPPPKPEPKPAPKPEPPKPDPEVERRKAEERARQERLAALAQQQFMSALENEASQASAVDAAAEATLAQSYQMGIYQAVINNWSRPPSARNRMETKLLVELVPTGDVVGVNVVASSGDAAFDRSAEAAVRKARRFEVPKEPDVFERHFRRFTLLFRPEDLLR
jgi:TonB family protein